METIPLIYLDTHAIAWIYGNQLDKLGKLGKELIYSNHDLRISPMVMLELDYLHQLGRTNEPAKSVLSNLTREIGLRVCDKPFPLVAEAAGTLAWTRDPFDRVIVGQATLNNNILITKDSHILENYPHAVW